MCLDQTHKSELAERAKLNKRYKGAKDHLSDCVAAAEAAELAAEETQTQAAAAASEVAAAAAEAKAMA